MPRILKGVKCQQLIGLTKLNGRSIIMEVVLGIVLVVALGVILLKPSLTEQIKNWILNKLKK